MYGLKASGNAFFHHLSDSLRQLGFRQSKLDLALWYREREDGTGYDYFSHHVDYFLVSGKIPQHWINMLEKTYSIPTQGEVKHHLGFD